MKAWICEGTLQLAIVYKCKRQTDLNCAVKSRILFVVNLTWRQTDAISLVVEEPPPLGQLALPLDHVVHHGALHHEGVHPVLLQHPLNPLLVGLGPDARSLIHVGPHLGVGAYFRILK